MKKLLPATLVALITATPGAAFACPATASAALDQAGNAHGLSAPYMPNPPRAEVCRVEAAAPLAAERQVVQARQTGKHKPLPAKAGIRVAAF